MAYTAEEKYCVSQLSVLRKYNMLPICPMVRRLLLKNQA